MSKGSSVWMDAALTHTIELMMMMHAQGHDAVSKSSASLPQLE